MYQKKFDINMIEKTFIYYNRGGDIKMKIIKEKIF